MHSKENKEIFGVEQRNIMLLREYLMWFCTIGFLTNYTACMLMLMWEWLWWLRLQDPSSSIFSRNDIFKNKKVKKMLVSRVGKLVNRKFKSRIQEKGERSPHKGRN